jgi:hypothetical protein
MHRKCLDLHISAWRESQMQPVPILLFHGHASLMHIVSPSTRHCSSDRQQPSKKIKKGKTGKNCPSRSPICAVQRVQFKLRNRRGLHALSALYTTTSVFSWSRCSAQVRIARDADAVSTTQVLSHDRLINTCSPCFSGSCC